MQKRFIAIWIYLLLPLSCNCTPSQLEVAAILPLSGKASSFGNAARNGILLAVNESPTKNLHLKFYDNKFEVKSSVQIFKGAVAIQQPDIIISIGASHGNALAPLAEKEGIVHFSASSDPATSKGRQYTLRTWSSGEEEGALIAKEIEAQKLLPSAIALTPNDYHIALRAGLLANMSEEFIELNEEFSSIGNPDFTPFLLRAKKRGVKSLALFLHPGLSAILSKQAHVLKFHPQYFSGVQFESQAEIAASNGALAGGNYVTVDFSDEFKAKYVAQYDSSDSLSLAAVHYELTRMLQRLSNEYDRASLLNHILSLQKKEGLHFASRLVLNKVML